MELKVRVYDKERKRFIYNVGLMPPKLQGQAPYLITSEYIYIRPGDPIAETFYAIDYYTNFTDKHDTDIYENDIVSIGAPGTADLPGCLVGFKAGGFVIFAPWIKGPDNDIALRAYINKVFVGCVEVIGSIHENPELLTEQK